MQDSSNYPARRLGVNIMQDSDLRDAWWVMRMIQDDGDQ